MPSPSHSGSQQKAAGKRRHEDTEDEMRDHSMDRSPTPESKAVRRIIPKKMRTLSTLSSLEGVEERGEKTAAVTDEVDVGMLLGKFCALDTA